ncbi:dGTP triphosphohydrolase [Proteiniclasticum ruminis]|uniref:dGTP triphosphohydrolase n=1 Tax=Proteiniclasticum ruminis TaxID=398199 RepID=UPI0028A89CFD|nr:dNTP triphosphohydrolase [Proteiniclasticum ruminis]
MSTSIFRANENFAKRVFNEDEHEYRTKFQRDRDRVLYSKEFRRLSGKTQVFVAGFDDHMRTRLTHTLEVAQIADTIARALELNEVLVEAIAFGHDVGHTPFGHVGERILNKIMNGCMDINQFNTTLESGQRGFKHNWQGIRVVADLEQISSEYKGLNLTNYTRWGILNHTKKNYKKCEHLHDGKCTLMNRSNTCDLEGAIKTDYYNKYSSLINDTQDWTFEGVTVAVADEIAQRHHDIEDALHARIISIIDVCNKFEQYFSGHLKEDQYEILEDIKTCDEIFKTSKLSKLIVNFYTDNYIKLMKQKMVDLINSFNLIDEQNFEDKKAEIYNHLIEKYNEESIVKALSFSKEKMKDERSFSESDELFQKYLSSVILKSELAQSMDGKADYIIRQLFKAYLTNPQQLPDKTVIKVYESIKLRYEELMKESDREERDESIDKIIKESTVNDKILFYEARQRVEKLMVHRNSVIDEIILRTVCDFIAGMTDQFALDQFDRLYGSGKYRKI